MKLVNKIIKIMFIICLFVSNLYVPKVEAKTVGDYKIEMDNFIKDYEENIKNQQLSEAELNRVKKRINEINTTIGDISNEIILINSQIDKLNEDIKQKESEIEDILFFFQLSNGENAYLEYAFGAKTFTDFIYRLAVSEQLTSYNDELVNTYRKNIEDSKEKQKELAKKQIDLQEKQKELQKESVKIQNQIKDFDKMGLSLEEKIEASKKQYKFYIENGCSESDTITDCETKILPETHGVVRPFSEGFVTSWFGNRDCSNPIVGCFHRGLDLSINGANYDDYYIYPIADGKVVYTIDPNKNVSSCGGYRVFIQHNINGKTIISGYWHMRKRLVGFNEYVTKDTPIGVMGGNPYKEYWDNCTTGAHLHLEISTGGFSPYGNTYYSYRINPAQYVNVPYGDVVNGPLYVKWFDRTSLYKNGHRVG